MNGSESDTTTRRLRVLRNALVAVALVSVTYPWTSGAYTWLAQRQLASSLHDLSPRSARSGPATSAPSPRSAPKAASSPRPFGDALDGWEREDRAYWRRLAEGGAFGRLTAPAADVDVTVVKGVRDRDLRRGPGWVTTTDLPGSRGNVGISGHRTTFLAPFRKLDRLRAGDTIRLTSPFRVYTYRVVDRTFVNPDDVDVFSTTGEPMLTLTACHPPYSFQFRIVVRSRLVRVMRR